MIIRQNRHLTFRGNDGAGRHGWLRLTPAYSYRMAEDALGDARPGDAVLDPFAGTGTTGLAAARRGMSAVLLDVNPFLAWLARAKCRNYSDSEIRAARNQTRDAIAAASSADADKDRDLFIPPIHRIERWWSADVLIALARLKRALADLGDGSPADDLPLIAFCRAMIASSNAAFNHQSMSFGDGDGNRNGNRNGNGRGMLDGRTALAQTLDSFAAESESVIASAAERMAGSAVSLVDDARRMASVPDGAMDAVITSPPYANRMSYIRETRPYMYWLGYLANGADAGDLDWRAIGGTWGSATSRLAGWQANAAAPLPMEDELRSVLERIESARKPNAALLAKYVHRYFRDMFAHFRQARRVLKPGGRAAYIVGNSTFYGTVVPTQRWHAEMMRAVGFENAAVETVRKRNSNKRLFEYKVEAVRA